MNDDGGCDCSSLQMHLDPMAVFWSDTVSAFIK